MDNTFTIPISYRKFEKFVPDFIAVMAYYKNNIKVVLDAKAVEFFKKYATVRSEYQGYQHFSFYDDEDNLIFGLVIDRYSNEVEMTEFPRKNGKVWMIIPKPFPEKRMIVYYSNNKSSKKKK